MNTTDAAGRTEQADLARWFSSRQAHVYALGFWILSLAVFWRPLESLANLAFHDERSSHVLFIPVISGFLVFLKRSQIFRPSRYCPRIGIPLLLIAAVVWLTLRTPLSRLNNIDKLSGFASLIVLVWIAGFILCYGMGSFRVAMFPLLFLALMIPIPVALAEKAVSLLQTASAATCYIIFRLVGVPIFRHGFQFSLPGAEIEVAEACSGIHSALALFVAGLLLQHFLLLGAWRKVIFTLCIFPVAIFKNAVRIVTITWLGIHVSPGFFHGQLHRQGGLPFSVLAIAMLGLLLKTLRRRPIERAVLEH